ncbi:3162_t:CDS:10 [Ambispora gerdemannii]|uniref:3162_t:CDS:1 n=1 Tax=Ambispora gerdemannii TaxID=144530 RepID=A0A9N8VU03_9GLOM|nr:3162_t:CDS:10 [Ambispora gerdemannii]
MSSLLNQRYLLGLIVLLSVVFIWVGSAFLMNNMFANQDYNKPFAITYINQSSFSLYLLFTLFSKKNLASDKQRSSESNHDTTSRIFSESIESTKFDLDKDNISHHHLVDPDLNNSENNEETTFLLGSTRDPHDVLSDHGHDKLTKNEIAKLGLIFCVLWFLGCWCNNASLAYTNVSSSTIMASMSGIGTSFGIEKFSLIKLMAVMISVTGVTLISFSDKSDTSDNPNKPSAPLLGDLLSLLGAFFYGCNIVLLKRQIRDESRIDMHLFLGYVGVFTFTLLWPVFYLFDITGIEKFQLPSTDVLWLMVAINALIGTFLSDYLWLLATFMTSPLVVTLGLSLTIPLALAGDVLYKEINLGTQYWIGAVFVLGGFLAVNLSTLQEQKQLKLGEDDDDLNSDNNNNTTSLPNEVHTSSRSLAAPISNDATMHYIKRTSSS